MAQLVARLVRNEKVGGSNPPSSTTGRHPIRMSVFSMPGVVLRCLLLWCFVAAGVPGAPFRCFVGPGRCVCRWAAARPRDRHTRACGSEWSISRPALALPPPTGTAAGPSGPSGALHTGGAWSLMCGSARRLEARPGPAGLAAASNRSRCLYVARTGPVAAHGRRRLALRSLRHPSHLWAGALACALSPVKPTTPLQARYTHFWCYFIAQRRRGFHTGVLRFPHWC